jgi:hypothetical protein
LCLAAGAFFDLSGKLTREEKREKPVKRRNEKSTYENVDVIKNIYQINRL